MGVVCTYAQSRSPADVCEGEVLVEWNGSPPCPLSDAVAGVETWGNQYQGV